MDVLFDSGLAWIEAVQQLGGPLLDDFFRGVTFMGEELFFLLMLPLLFWSVDVAVGARVAFIFLISSYLNPLFKDIWREPRPFDLNPPVKLSEADGFGMPSGHSQNSVIVWGALAWQIGKKWLWGLAIIVMFLIGFSRIYLGVHFPHQVLAGWAVGIVLLVVYIALEPRVEGWLRGLTLSRQLALAIVIPVLLAILYTRDSTVAAMAVMSGVGCGLALMVRYVPFSASGAWWLRLARYVVGLAVLLGLYFGLSALLPDDPAWAVYPLRFVRYAVLGLWIALGAPWLFSVLHLSGTAVARPGLQG